MRVLLAAAVCLCLAVSATAGPPAELVACSFPDSDGAIQRFSTMLTFATVSDAAKPGHLSNPRPFSEQLAFLQRSYPLVWQRLRVERVGDGNHSLLLTWAGGEPSLPPALFISHLDVVPVTPGTEGDWRHPPFSGAVAEGFIWGRGALDVKNGVAGLLESAAALLQEGYVPRRTLLLAFGQDEEVGGDAGAGSIAALLAARGVTELAFVWDEGGVVYASGLQPFTAEPVALVATAEKYYQTVAVTLHSGGGHSSMPPTDGSSIGGRLGRLLSGLTASPPAPRVVSPTRELLAGLLELAPGWLQALRVLSKVVPAQVDMLLAHLLAAAGAATAALVRDTAAVTLVAAGVADNVLPQTAEVSLNFRLLPGAPPNTTLQYVRGWLGPDAAHANISLVETGMPPSEVTDARSEGFQVLKAAIQAVWRLQDGASGSRPVPVLPYLMPGGTDSKHYTRLGAARSILRFSPLFLAPEDLSLVHGTNERIAVDDFVRLLCTYKAGLRLAGDAAGSSSSSSSVAAV